MTQQPLSSDELAFRTAYILVRQWQSLQVRAHNLASELKLSPEWVASYVASGQHLLGGEDTYEAAKTYLQELGPGMYEVHKFGGFLQPSDPYRPAIISIRFCSKEDMRSWLDMIKGWYGPLGLNAHVDEVNNIVSV